MAFYFHSKEENTISSLGYADQENGLESKGLLAGQKPRLISRANSARRKHGFGITMAAVTLVVVSGVTLLYRAGVICKSQGPVHHESEASAYVLWVVRGYNPVGERCEPPPSYINTGPALRDCTPFDKNVSSFDWYSGDGFSICLYSDSGWNRPKARIDNNIDCKEEGVSAAFSVVLDAEWCNGHPEDGPHKHSL
jgi:hypothetical protein